MKKKLNLKHLIPVIILLLLLSGCNTGTSPNITSSTPATTEKTPESSDISSVNNSSETPSSDISTASTESSSLNPVSSAPQTNSNPATSSETSSSTASSTPPSSNVSTSDTQTSIDLEELVTAMIYTDAMQGSAVDFKTESVSTSGVEHKWKSHSAVIDSYNQLKKIYDSDYDESNQHYDKDYINAYNDKFFEDNVLIMLFIENGSSFIPSIEAVTKKDNKAIICVDYTEEDDYHYLDSICNIRTQITVSKADMANITDIVVCKK